MFKTENRFADIKSSQKKPNLLGLVLSFSCLFLVTCDDPDDGCSAVCSKLVGCENEWLEDEGDSPMTLNEMNKYYSECSDDCLDNGEFSDRECLDKADCSQILDGKCSS